VDWQQLGEVLGVAGAAAGGAWKLGSTWTKKAIAIGEKAAAEREKEKEITELRASHAKFMERFEGLVKEVTGMRTEISVLSTKVEERERARRDTHGIPVRSDGE
jgi:hypothetical protein